MKLKSVFILWSVMWWIMAVTMAWISPLELMTTVLILVWEIQGLAWYHQKIFTWIQANCIAEVAHNGHTGAL